MVPESSEVFLQEGLCLEGDSHKERTLGPCGITAMAERPCTQAVFWNAVEI